MAAADNAGPPLRIMFPPNNSRVELTTYDGKPDPLALKITGGVEPLTVLVNGVPAPRAPTAARCSSSPTGRASCGSP